MFSGVVNLLTLSGSLYMLQVYDRVIPSHNVATLFGLSAIVAVAYLLQGYFDALRGRMLTRIGALFDVKLQSQIHFALVSLPLRGTQPILAQQPLRDLDQIRVFLSGAVSNRVSRHALDPALFDRALPLSSGDRRRSDLRGDGDHRHDDTDRTAIAKRGEGIDGRECSAPGAGGRSASER